MKKIFLLLLIPFFLEATDKEKKSPQYFDAGLDTLLEESNPPLYKLRIESEDIKGEVRSIRVKNENTGKLEDWKLTKRMEGKGKAKGEYLYAGEYRIGFIPEDDKRLRISSEVQLRPVQEADAKGNKTIVLFLEFPPTKEHRKKPTGEPTHQGKRGQGKPGSDVDTKTSSYSPD